MSWGKRGRDVGGRSSPTAVWLSAMIVGESPHSGDRGRSPSHITGQTPVVGMAPVNYPLSLTHRLTVASIC